MRSDSNRRHRHPDARDLGGFTLVELLVVLALFALVTTLGFPALHKLIIRSELEGYASETAMLLQRTRYEAIERSLPAVVELDATGKRIRSFLDVDEDLGFTAGTDEELGSRSLSYGLSFGGPPNGTALDRKTILGFTALPTGDRAAVYDPDGSVRDSGAFRVGDVRGNYLEIRIEPQATGRVEIRKWQELTAGSGSSIWLVGGDQGHPWRWKV